MSGIAGLINLAEKQPVPPDVLRWMSAAMSHRGPDDEALWQQPGLGMAWRQGGGGTPGRNATGPATNEAGDLLAVLDGALFNAEELRSDLERVGHRPARHAHAALLPHLWEEYGDRFLDRLCGQFAGALWDGGQNRLVLFRDRLGICPLHWTRQGDWLLFASEIKSLLASGMVPARADLRGIAQVFTFFGLPGPVTCFEGVASLVPGHWLEVRAWPAAGPHVREHCYWELDFPDRGDEAEAPSEEKLLDQYQSILSRAVARRLRCVVPAACYSSGGLDSSMIVALASALPGESPATFTFEIAHPSLRESAGAKTLARHVRKEPTVVTIRPTDLVGAFPGMVRAAESPVIDTSAAALFLLAEAARDRGWKAALSGEGADEFQGGYPWFRIDRKLSLLDVLPGLSLNRRAFWGYARLVHARGFRWSAVRRAEQAAAGHNAWLIVYHLMGANRDRFFSTAVRKALGDYHPYEDVRLNRPRMKCWHPFNRSVYTGVRIHLTGLHMAARGDRSAQHAGVQPRYPFLDEELVEFFTRLHPRWKMRGFQDKYLQRKLAGRLLPRELTRGRKHLPHAPLDAFYLGLPGSSVEQLLSEEALGRTGYFEPRVVKFWRQRVQTSGNGYHRLMVRMGLVGVISTQLWHHTYLDSSLAEFR
jgi:asparagine synthase (glutamine-hydrolysing)